MISKIRHYYYIIFLLFLSSCEEGTDGKSYLRFDNNNEVTLLRFTSNANIQNYNIDSNYPLRANAKGKFFRILPGNYTCTIAYIENDEVIEKTGLPFIVEIDKGQNGSLLRSPDNGEDRYYTLLVGSGGSINITYSFSP